MIEDRGDNGLEAIQETTDAESRLQSRPGKTPPATFKENLYTGLPRENTLPGSGSISTVPS